MDSVKIVRLNQSLYINEYNELCLNDIIDFDDWFDNSFSLVYVVVPAVGNRKKDGNRDYGIEVYDDILNAIEYAESTNGVVIEKLCDMYLFLCHGTCFIRTNYSYSA